MSPVTLAPGLVTVTVTISADLAQRVAAAFPNPWADEARRMEHAVVDAVVTGVVAHESRRTS